MCDDYFADKESQAARDMVAKNPQAAWSKKLLTGTAKAAPASKPAHKNSQQTQQNLRNFLVKKKNERILVIGDGNFSFSSSLVDLFGGDASKIVATCYDCEETLHRKYSDAAQYIEKIRDSGGSILFNVDGTKSEPSLVQTQIHNCRFLMNRWFRAGSVPAQA